MMDEVKEGKATFLDIYAKISLKLLGPIIAYTSQQELNLFEAQLRKARIELGAKKYLSSAIFSAILFCILVFFLLHTFTFHPASIFEAYSMLLRNFIISSVFSILLLGVSYLYPYSVSDIREANIDSNLVFSMNYIVAMLKAGASLEEALIKMSDAREFGEFRHEARKFAMHVQKGDMPPAAAIRTVSDECPSNKLQNILYTLSIGLSEGESPKKFLEGEMETYLQDHKQQEEEKIDRIHTLTHTYLILLIIIPSLLMLALVLLTMDPLLSSFVNQYQLFTISPIFLLSIDILYLSYLELKEPEV